MSFRVLGLLAAAFAIVVSLAGSRIPFGVVLALGTVLVLTLVVALTRRH